MLKGLQTVAYATSTFARWLRWPLQPSSKLPAVPSRLRLGAFISPWPKLFQNFCPFWWLGILGVIVSELDNIRRRLIKDQSTHLSLSTPANLSRPRCDDPQPNGIYIYIRREAEPGRLRIHQECHLPSSTVSFSFWPVAEFVALGASRALAINLRFLELGGAVSRRLDEEGLIFRLRPAALRVLRDFALVMAKSIVCLERPRP